MNISKFERLVEGLSEYYYLGDGFATFLRALNYWWRYIRRPIGTDFVNHVWYHPEAFCLLLSIDCPINDLDPEEIKEYDPIPF